MRIAIDGRPISVYPGIGRYCLNLIKNIARLDDKNEYIILKPRQLEGKIVSNPNFRELTFSPPLVSLSSLTTLAKLLKREKVDLFHATSDIAPLNCPCKLVVTIHDVINLTSSMAFQHQPFYLAYFLRQYFKIVGRSSMKSATRIIAISENTKKDIVKHFPYADGKVEVVYEAVEDSFAPVHDETRLKEVKAKYSLPDNFIFYTGSTKENKNLFGLLDGFCNLVKKGNPPAGDVKLVIAGFKHFRTEKITERVDKLGLTNRVAFVGFIDEDDLPAVYSSARLFVYPSLHEGFGLPLLEAMACDTVITASNMTSIPEIVGDAAILCDPRSPEKLARAMKRGVEDEDLREELIRRGRKRLSHFSWLDTARKTLDIYNRAFESGENPDVGLKN